MDLAPLEITPEDAERRLDAYRAQVAEERTVEDEAIAAGYRAAARGLPVIDLPTVVTLGGWFDRSGLPRIAVTRADATTCWVRRSWGAAPGTDRLVFTDQEGDRGRARVGRHRVSVDVPAWVPSPDRNGRAWDGSTIVPSIPPDVRPRRHRLWRFHVLWEVEKWDPTPPVDPALLRHIRGNLWSVVATWDLTPLERAVLAGRSS